MSGEVQSIFKLCGVHPKQLVAKETLYRRFAIPASPYNSTRVRRIHAPMEPLLSTQRNLLNKLLIKFAPHWSATAYYPGRSTVRNAIQHAGKPFLFKTDVKSFFDSISVGFLREQLPSHFVNISSQQVEDILHICTLNKALPQGAPTSPHLSNLAMYRVDEIMSAFCVKRACVYTRYADDISISSTNLDGLLEARKLLKSTIHANGLNLNLRKTRLFGENQRKTVSGIDVTSTTLRPPRRIRRKVKQALHKAEIGTPLSPIKVARIKGFISYWHSVSPNDPELKVAMTRASNFLHPDW